MSNYLEAKQRYRTHRKNARELLEEEIFHTTMKRVDVVSIDDDICRRVRKEWSVNPERLVDWDWEKGIIAPLHRKNARYFDFAMLVDGQLCGLAAVRMSDAKQWLSLTHLEGAPGDHPLKGKVVPFAITGMYVYRSVVCSEQQVGELGLRILNPLDEAMTTYEKHGYTLSASSKRLRSIEIEPRKTA